MNSLRKNTAFQATQKITIIENNRLSTQISRLAKKQPRQTDQHKHPQHHPASATNHNIIRPKLRSISGPKNKGASPTQRTRVPDLCDWAPALKLTAFVTYLLGCGVARIE